jgi:PTS system mannose-specific IIB component
MNIVLIRVDNRLVHGQIIEAWIPYMEATRIIIADDGVATDFFRESVIRMAVPRDIDLVVVGLEELSNKYNLEQRRGRKTIVIFQDILSAWKAYHYGFKFKHINLGNVYAERCQQRCTPSVLLGEDDIKHLADLLREGVFVDVRRVPGEKAISIRDFITLT